MKPLQRTFLLAGMLMLFAPLTAEAALLTLIDHWVREEDWGWTGWQDAYRNDKSYPVRVTFRFSEGNDADGETYTSTETTVLQPGIQIGTWDRRWPEDGLWDRQTILEEVGLSPPVITSSNAKSATQGQATSYAITTTNAAPTSFHASSLPSGLVLNSSSGVISGTPAAAGTFTSTISATNAYGNGSLTLTWNISGVSDSIAPSTPTGLQSYNVACFAFRLGWSASTDNIGVTAYEVRRDGTSVGTTSDTTFDLTGLAQSTSYSMTVRARDYAGNWSAWSTAFTVTTSADLIPPTVPADFLASGRTANAFNLSWTASSDNNAVAGYDVRRNDGTTFSVTAPAAALTGLQPFTTYAMSVRARDVNGNVSDWSPELNVRTTGGGLTLIGQSTYNSSTWEGWDKGWRNMSNVAVAVGYEYRTNDGDGNEHAETASAIVNPGADFGEWDWTRYDAENDRWYSEARIILSQEAASIPAIGGVLSRKAAVGVPFSYAIAAANGATSYTATGLPSGLSLNTSTGIISGTASTIGSYNVALAATNGSGTARANLALTVIADVTPPGAPAGLIVAGAAPGFYNLRWSAATDDIGVTAYEVRQDGVSMGILPELNLDLPIGTVNQSRAVAVRARDGTGNWSAWSNVLSVPIRGITVQNGSCAFIGAVAGTVISIVADTAPSGKYFAGWTVAGPGALNSSAHPRVNFTVGHGSVVLRAAYLDGYKLTVPEGSFASAYGGTAGTQITITAPEATPGEAFNGWDLRGAAVLERPSQRINAPVKLLGGDVDLNPWYLWNANNGSIWAQTAHYAVGGSWTPERIGLAEGLIIMSFATDNKRPVTWQRIEKSTDLGRTWQVATDIYDPPCGDYSSPPFLYLYLTDTRQPIGFGSLGRTLIRTASFDGLIASMWAYTSVDVVEGQTVIPWAVVTRQPLDYSAEDGKRETVTFSVTIAGPSQYPNFTYRWIKAAGGAANWAPLSDVPTSDGRGVSGTTTATLKLEGVEKSDEADYLCLISDGRTTYATSRARLTVAAPAPPEIKAPPESLSKNVGESAEFSVTIGGVPTPRIEWRRAGVPIPGENRAVLRIDNVAMADAGLYTVKVGVTADAPSASATLSVSDLNAPSAPSNLQVATTTATTVTLTWNAPATSASPILAYAIYRDGTAAPIAFVNANSSSLRFVDSVRAPGAQHTYAVTAVSANSESPRSSAISATTTNGAIQSDPSNTNTRLNVHLPAQP